MSAGLATDANQGGNDGDPDIPYHSIDPSDPDVYHDYEDCPNGQQIPPKNRRDGTNPDKDDVHEFKPAWVILRARHIDARKTTRFVMARGVRPDLKGAGESRLALDAELTRVLELGMPGLPGHRPVFEEQRSPTQIGM